MELLLYLADRPGAVVSIRQLKRSVWGREFIVDEAVKRCISQIRRSFGDCASRPRVIETVRKRGYRLIASVARREARVQGSKHYLRLAGAVAAVILMLAFAGSANVGDIIATPAIMPAGVELHSAARTQYLQYDRDDMATSIAMYEFLVQKNAEDAIAHAGLANALLQTYLRWGRDEAVAARAFNAATLAVSLDRDLPEAHKALGAYFHFRGEAGPALRHYASALRLNPDYWNALNNGAEVLRDLGEYSAARNLFACALHGAPGKTDILLRLAEVEILDGRFDDAASYINLASLLQPSHQGIEVLSERMKLARMSAEGDRLFVQHAEVDLPQLVSELEGMQCVDGDDLIDTHRVEI